jgi:hypothetical protein
MAKWNGKESAELMPIEVPPQKEWVKIKFTIRE